MTASAAVVRCPAMRCADLSGSAPERITDHVHFDPALAIKFSISRTRPSGSPGDGDIFGSQQYGPLLSVEIAD